MSKECGNGEENIRVKLKHGQCLVMRLYLSHPTFPFTLLKPFPSYLPILFNQTFPILPSPSHYSNLSHSTFPFYLIKPSPLLITQTFPILPSPSLYSNLSHPTFPFSLLKPWPPYLPLLLTQPFFFLPSLSPQIFTILPFLSSQFLFFPCPL